MDPAGSGTVSREAFLAAGGTEAEFELYDLDKSNSLDQGELEARAAAKALAEKAKQLRRLVQQQQALVDLGGTPFGGAGGGEGSSGEEEEEEEGDGVLHVYLLTTGAGGDINAAKDRMEVEVARVAEQSGGTYLFLNQDCLLHQ